MNIKHQQPKNPIQNTNFINLQQISIKPLQNTKITLSSSNTPTNKSYRGVSPSHYRKNQSNHQKIREKIDEGLNQPNRIQCHTEQSQLDEKKNILGEFIKYNQKRKQSNNSIQISKGNANSYDSSKNKNTLGMNEDETQNYSIIDNIYTYHQTCENTLNKSLNLSTRSTPKGANYHKENLNPKGLLATMNLNQKIKFEKIQQQQNIVHQKINTPLKIYKNNKIYNNQYTQKFSKEGDCQQNIIKYNGDCPQKLKYIETDLSNFQINTTLNDKGCKTPNKEMSQLNYKKERSSSVIVKRASSSQGCNQKKNNCIQNRMKLNQQEIHRDTSQKKSRSKSNRLQLDDLSIYPINQDTSVYSSKQGKHRDSISEVGTRISTYAFSTKSTLRQQESYECQKTDSYSYQNQINFKTKEDTFQIHKKVYTEPNQIVTDLKVNQKSFWQKNNGRRVISSSTKRSSSVQPKIHNINLIHPDCNKKNKNLLTEQYQATNNLQDIFLTEQFGINELRNQEFDQKQQHNLNQEQYQTLPSNYPTQSDFNYNNQRELENQKLLVGNILKGEIDFKVPKENKQNTNKVKYDTLNDLSQNNVSKQSNPSVFCETELNTQQYILKLKNDKKKRQEEDHNRFLIEKQKAIEKQNEFLAKSQIQVIQTGKKYINSQDVNKINCPQDFYQIKNNFKMQEISRKCEKMYDECIEQLRYSFQIANQQNNINYKNTSPDSIQPTLPRYSPVNSSLIRSPRLIISPQQSRSLSFENNQNINIFQNSNMNNQQNGNSLTPQQKKKLNSKPLTISMQQYLNESVKSFNSKQQNSSLVQADDYLSPQKYSNRSSVNMTIDGGNLSSRLSSPKKRDSSQCSFDQSQKKKKVNINDNSNNKQENKYLKELNDQHENNNQNQVNLNAKHLTTPIKQKKSLTIIENQYEKIKQDSINSNQQTPKSDTKVPKSILKNSKKEWYESPSKQNSSRGSRDITIGNDGEINYSLNEEICSSQPTNYTKMHEQKKIIENAQLIHDPIQQISFLQEESMKLNYYNSKYINEDFLNNQPMQQGVLLYENDDINKVYQSQNNQSLQFSKEFSDTLQQSASNKNQISTFQCNQITEVSNTEDEFSSENTQNFIKSQFQESKYSISKLSQPNIQESQTRFSQKMFSPMQIIHESKCSLYNKQEIPQKQQITNIIQNLDMKKNDFQTQAMKCKSNKTKSNKLQEKNSSNQIQNLYNKQQQIRNNENKDQIQNINEENALLKKKAQLIQNKEQIEANLNNSKMLDTISNNKINKMDKSQEHQKQNINKENKQIKENTDYIDNCQKQFRNQSIINQKQESKQVSNIKRYSIEEKQFTINLQECQLSTSSPNKNVKSENRTQIPIEAQTKQFQNQNGIPLIIDHFNC